MIGAFEGFALDDPLSDPLEFIRQEWKLIEWYRDHGQMLQAVTLAREAMVDAIAHRLEEKIDLKRDQRTTIERGVSGIVKIGQPIYDETLDTSREFGVNDLNAVGFEIYRNWDDATEVGKTFDALTKIRNQLNHAEHQVDRMKLAKIEVRIPQVLMSLHFFLKKWGILADGVEQPQPLSSDTAVTPS